MMQPNVLISAKHVLIFAGSVLSSAEIVMIEDSILALVELLWLWSYSRCATVVIVFVLWSCSCLWSFSWLWSYLCWGCFGCGHISVGGALAVVILGWWSFGCGHIRVGGAVVVFQWQ